MSFDSYIDKFIAYKNIEAGFSLRSLTAYRTDLRDFWQKIGYTADRLSLVHKGILEDYIISLYNSGYKTSSINRKISAIKQFFAFLYLEKYISENPALKLEHGKPEKNLPEPLSQNEFELLIAEAKKGQFPHNLRFIALMELCYGAGLRVSELVSMPLSALHPDKNYAIIMGKGQKERLIPLGSLARKALLDYLPYRLFFCQDRENHFLFPSTGREGHLTRVRFFQILKSLAPATGIASERLHPHNFRHSFATDLLRGGADLKSVQSFLGHESITTTERYTHLCTEDIEKALLENHPLEKNKIEIS